MESPKLLPVRLVALQKVCVAAVFEANPAGCPAASVVGHAMVITPLLPVPLTGPVYFVSYGGAVFPELVIVLQGYGVTVDLVGQRSSAWHHLEYVQERPRRILQQLRTSAARGELFGARCRRRPLPALVHGDQRTGDWVVVCGAR